MTSRLVSRFSRRTDRRTDRRPTSRPVRLSLLAGGLLILPVVVAVGSLIGRHWYATTDQALELLRISDVGGRHTPLYGVQSRFGWYHPGPALYWLTAPAYRLLGDTGVLAAVGLLNTAALGGVVVLAHRRGGPLSALAVALFSAVLIHGMGPALLIDVWNPWAAVVPFLFFTVLVWSVIDGDRWAWPWLVGVGSFSMQTHVGYVPLVAGLSLLAAGWALARRAAAKRARGRAGQPGVGAVVGEHGPLPLSLLVGVLMWLPPAVQQLTGHPGNLTALWDYFRDPPEAAAGWSAALNIMGHQLKPVGPWMTGHDLNAVGFLDRTSPWAGLVLVLAAAGLGTWASRSRTPSGRSAGRLAAVAVTGAALGTAATARITGLQANYLVRWAWVLAMLLWLSAAWSAAVVLSATSGKYLGDRRWPGRPGPWSAALPVVLLVTLAAVTVPTTVTATSTRLPFEVLSQPVPGLAPVTAAALDRHRRYLFTWVDSTFLGAVAVGLQHELESRGYRVLYEPLHAKDAGSWRTATSSDTDATISVIAGPDLAGWLPLHPGARRVADFDPISAADRRLATTLDRRIRVAAHMTDAPGRLGTSPRFVRDGLVALGARRADVDTLDRLQQQGDPYTVFLQPNR